MDIATIGFKADVRGLSKAGRELDTLARKGGKAERKVNSSTKSMVKGFMSLKSAIGVAAAAMAAFGVYSAVKQIANFETELNKLKAVSGSTESQMKALEKQARSLGATTTFAANQAAQAQVFLAQAGFKSNEILKATPGILKLAIAGNLDLARAADIASNVLGGMALKVDDLTRVNDVMAQTASSANTNIEQLGTALSYAAPFAVSAGLSIEQVAAAIGVLSNNGIQGTRAGTGLAGVIRQLSHVTPQAEKALEKYGLTTDDINLKTKGLIPVMRTLAKANLDTGDAITIFGTEAGVAGLTLSNFNKDLDTLTKSLGGAQGASSQMAATMSRGLAVSAKEFTSALSEMNLQLNDSFGLSQKASSALGEAADAINKISKALKVAYKTGKDSKTEFQPLYDSLIAIAKLSDATYTTIGEITQALILLYKVKSTPTSLNYFSEIKKAAEDAGRTISELQSSHIKFLKSLDQPDYKPSTLINLQGEVGKLIDLQKEYNDLHGIGTKPKQRPLIPPNSSAVAKATGDWIQMLSDQTDAFDKQQEAEKKLLDSSKSMIQDYGDTWTRTGNQVVDALGSMMAAIEKSSNLELKYTTKLNELKDAGLKKTQEYKDLEKARAKASVKGSLDMMAASVAMYKEGSDAQKAAHTAFLAMSAAELAMNIQRAISAATIAVANQGAGDPYTAFARIASMSVMMGGLLSQIGATFGSIGGSSAAVASQPAPGAGVLGGGTSTSIANTLSYMNEIQADQYTELKGIYDEIVNLNRNITGVLSTLYSTGDLSGLTSGTSNYNASGIQKAVTGLTDTLNNVAEKIPVIGGLLKGLNNIAGGAIGSLAVGLGFGGTSKSTSDYGIRVGGTLSSQDVTGYETIKSMRDPGWFQKTQVSYQDYQRKLSDQSKSAFATVFNNMRKSFIDIGKTLNKDVTDQVNSFKIDIGKISMTGSSADIQKRLQKAFSGLSDKMAYDLFGSVIKGYRKVNESAFDTLSRLVIQKAATGAILGQTGQKFVGDAIALSQSLIQIAGGLKELQSAASTYFDKFFTDAQKAAYNQEQLTKVLASQNLTLPKTRAGYKALVESLDLSTKSGQEAYVTLLKASDMADKYYSTVEEGNNTAVQDRINLLNDEASAVQKSISSLQQLKTALQGTFTRIMGTTTSTASQYMSAQAQLAKALEQARSGNIPTAQSIQGALNMVSSNSASQYATLADYRRDQLKTAGMINDLMKYTGNQLTVEQSMLSELEKQTAILNNLGYAGLQQINGSHANGLDYVPFDGYTAKLHRGEMVVPAGQADYLRTGQMTQELRGLRVELSQIRQQDSKNGSDLVKYAKNSSDILDKWEGIGMPAVRA